VFGGYVHGGAREKFLGIRVISQQVLNFGAQFKINAASLFQIGGTLFGRAFQRLVKELTDLLIAFWRHKLALIC
jgi:hypothetical protein